MDIQIEVALELDVRPTGFDRLNTLWWTLALLRLYTGAVLRMPIMSSMSFSTASTSAEAPLFWPVETQSQQLVTDPDPPDVISEEHLVWLRSAFSQGAMMMNNRAFNRAFQTLDSVIWAHSTGSAIVMIWAALETLIAPGQKNITKKMASSLAALLELPGPKRDRMFQLIVKLYKARGSSAHASQSPEVEQLMSSFLIARRTFVTCINRNEVPNGNNVRDT